MTDPYVSAHALTKKFGGRLVLDSIDADVRPGDVVGLLGANGAGKTTLLEVLSGLSPPTTGSAQLFGGEAIAANTATKTRIGFVPQSDELIDGIRGGEYLDLIASFYPTWNRELVERLVAGWGIEQSKRISNYSLGQRQKLSIVSALAHQPDLLILDEPVASLDPIARRQFLQQIVELTVDERRAVLFSSHIVSDVERLANVIWILKAGKLLWKGDLDALKESVVRVHVPAISADAARAALRRVVVERTSASRTTLVALRAPDEDWSALAVKAGADAQIEWLGLEDIFLELHS
ncbi:MAG TPA: ABC transporter ATP-binding protein [Steroidobacteraceae bacterium]|nr:ABC transporter ATP-binding protein [Steroidobacteraceae bacterium]